MTTPTLGIVVDRSTAPEFADLLAVLRRWCRPVAWASGIPTPSAWITTSPAAAVPTGAPRAVWIEHADELAHPGVATAAVLVCADQRLADGADRGIAVTGTLDAADVPPLTPFVRSRYRRARGLPADFVIRVDDSGVRVLPHGAAIASALRDTAMAMAGAAVVHGRALATALTWATPCVTDPTSAAAIGAEDGVHVVINGGGDLYRDAVELAHDERRAAQLSLAGRRLVEATLDRVGPGRRIAAALGLHGATPASRFEAVLDDLNTPAAARIRLRARAAVPA